MDATELRQLWLDGGEPDMATVETCIARSLRRDFSTLHGIGEAWRRGYRRGIHRRAHPQGYWRDAPAEAVAEDAWIGFLIGTVANPAGQRDTCYFLINRAGDAELAARHGEAACYTDLGRVQADEAAGAMAEPD